MPEYIVLIDDDDYAHCDSREEADRVAADCVARRPYPQHWADVKVVEVVAQWQPVDAAGPGGEVTCSYTNVAGPTDSDRLRAELAECKEWLARFSRDSEAYQLGVEAERRRVLGLIGGRLNDTASEDVVEFALRAGGAMSSQTAAYEKGRRNVLLTIREDLAGNREAVGGEE